MENFKSLSFEELSPSNQNFVKNYTGYLFVEDLKKYLFPSPGYDFHTILEKGDLIQYSPERKWENTLLEDFNATIDSWYTIDEVLQIKDTDFYEYLINVPNSSGDFSDDSKLIVYFYEIRAVQHGNQSVQKTLTSPLPHI